MDDGTTWTALGILAVVWAGVVIALVAHRLARGAPVPPVLRESNPTQPWVL